MDPVTITVTIALLELAKLALKAATGKLTLAEWDRHDALEKFLDIML